MSYRLITFDVYTALFDIETSLAPVAYKTLDIKDPLPFIRDWRRKQLELALISNSLNKHRIPFADLTSRALEDTLIHHALAPTKSAKETLLYAWLTLQLWSEAPHVLKTLHVRGYTLALLSNGDEHQLRTHASQLPPVFTHIFSSEQAGQYKPHPSVYQLPLHTLNLQPHEVLHVAGSPTDALGTKSAGLHCAWSNRKSEPLLNPTLPVDYNMKDLSNLLTILP